MRKLQVFVSSDQLEFQRKRKRLEALINKDKYLECKLLENRGADTVDKKTRSIQAVKKCDFYIGIFGKNYSELAADECIEALNENKRNLIYLLDVKEENREPLLRDFIKNVLTDRITYHRFKKCKKLEEQIEEDLQSQMEIILRTGLDVLGQIKSELIRNENSIKQELSKIGTGKEFTYLRNKIRSNFQNQDNLSLFVSLWVLVEKTVRRSLTKLTGKNYDRSPFYKVLREAKTKGLIEPDLIPSLEDFRVIRNRALHEGLIPSNVELKQLLRIVDGLQRPVSTNGVRKEL